MRFLVVEDEKKVAGFIKRGLEQEGYIVDLAVDGMEGEEYATSRSYDMIILDIMLPKKDGLEVLKTVKEDGVKAPVILLTARDSVEDRVRGLNLGADDYLTKPFAFEELLARVRALLRRGSAKVVSNVIEYEGLALDSMTRKASRDGKEIELTLKEYSLLEYLLRNPERVLSRTLIAENVWHQGFDSETNVVDVYINHLRNKVDKDPVKKLIHTVRGVGYVIKRSEDK
ncbi:Two component signal transduction response regulator [hydrothermal vent metagenome]|uniref:Two component signal transduction response regulator n=1 Tax=hydrothermal vent metagenome TaxID=652676 RepID=A0A3B0W1S9_9ZZZZ